MRILYDGTIFSMQKAGGINRYFANLINRLPGTVYPTLSVEGDTGLNFPSHHNLKLHNIKQFDFRPRRLSRRLQRYVTTAATHPKKYDIVHPTYYASLTSRNFGEIQNPIVVTVYDMIHEVFPDAPDLADPGGVHACLKQSAILSAQAIICISENTKRDLLERYRIPAERVWVTHLASEIDAAQSHGPEAVPDQPYFLYVGSRSSYKNFGGLLEALSHITHVHPDVAVCVVGPPFTQSEEETMVRLRVSDKIHHYGQVDDAHLAKLYRSSLAFVYPSLYEGFGIPPLEAMACGTLVIAANRSSIPEVVGDAGLLFDPDSADDLTDILRSVIETPGHRDTYVDKGYAQAKRFSWDRTVSQTLDVYKAVLK